MARREVLSPSQRLGLDGLPVDLDERLMARHHTLSEEELAVVRRRRGPSNRLGFAVLLVLLRFPGRPLRSKERAPEKIVRYAASQVGEDPRAMKAYAAGRDATRRAHLSEIYEAFGFRPFDEGVRRELRAWLVGVAAMTDSGAALVEAPNLAVMSGTHSGTWPGRRSEGSAEAPASRSPRVAAGRTAPPSSIGRGGRKATQGDARAAYRAPSVTSRACACCRRWRSCQGISRRSHLLPASVER